MSRPLDSGARSPEEIARDQLQAEQVTPQERIAAGVAAKCEYESRGIEEIPEEKKYPRREPRLGDLVITDGEF